MPVSIAQRFIISTALLAGLAKTTSAQTTAASGILIGDAKSQPESLAMAPGGVLIVGSAGSPFIYKLRPNSTTAEKFIDATEDGPETHFLGVFAEASTNTVWACQLNPVINTTPPKRPTVLRAFDIETGKQKLRWTLPGDKSTCNDMAIGPDKSLYITDTANGKIYKLAPGTSTPELYLEHQTLVGVDGITFLDGTLYVNNVVFNKLYRIPIDAAGKPQTPVDIWMNQPVHGPDGMRAANGKLFIAENVSGKISVLSITGDKASVTVLKEDLKTPTGVEPTGHTLWFTERSTGKIQSILLPK